MTVELRDYQKEAIDAAAVSLKNYKRVVVVAPTASGKSVIMAGMIKRILDKNPKARVLALCYIGEVLEQNHMMCIRMGVSSSGIYCAGIGRKNTNERVIHASRDSIGRNPLICGQFDFIIVDECHCVSLAEDDDTRYQKIFREINPKYIVGLTGTPWRLSGGIIFGKRKYWETRAYNISMRLLIDRGYLSPYILPNKDLTAIDTTEVKTKNGDFVVAQLEKVSSTKDVINKCLDSWYEHAFQTRRCSIFFCCSIAHAKLVEQMFAIKFPGTSIAYLDGAVDSKERKTMIERARRGEFKAIINVNCLTTGTDIPVIDCVVWLRATQSATLFVQGCGRGLRKFEGKENCLMLDMAGNFDRFKFIEDPQIVQTGSGKRRQFTDDELIAMGIDPAVMEEATKSPTKECPKCGAELHAAAKKCDDCGNIFISHDRNLFVRREAIDVISCRHKYVNSRNGNATLLVTYETKEGKYKEWIMVNKPFHQGKLWQRKRDLQLGILKITVSPARSQGYWNIEVVETGKLTHKSSSSAGYSPTASSVGAITQQESTIREQTPTEAKQELARLKA